MGTSGCSLVVRCSSLLLILLLASLPSVLSSSVNLNTRADSNANACNGYEELCDRAFTGIAFATTHNSFAYLSGVASNQRKDVEAQLKDGIRGFMLDFVQSSNASSMLEADDIYLCHTACSLLNAGPAVDTLKRIANFLHANTHDVVTLFVNNDSRFSALAMRAAFTAAGLDKLAYQPEGDTSASGAWPTLGDMITKNQRVVIFSSGQTDAASVPWILPESQYVWQTPWQVRTNDTFTCTIDRPKRPPYGPLQVLNHFVYTSMQLLDKNIMMADSNAASQTNHLDSLEAHYQQCDGTYASLASSGSNSSTGSSTAALIPNFVAVDFYDVGDLFQFVANLNNVTYRPNETKQSVASHTSTRITSTMAWSALLVAWAAWCS
ncbi:hypothetical protein H4R35_006898 [Dimargaris xerosporica]|nr:hypothetical protein H4R35_006898 [Dimargaris xerosporica]